MVAAPDDEYNHPQQNQQHRNRNDDYEQEILITRS